MKHGILGMWLGCCTALAGLAAQSAMGQSSSAEFAAEIQTSFGRAASDCSSSEAVVAAQVASSLSASPQAVPTLPGFGNLGAASGFSVLATDGCLTASNSAFQSGSIGVAAAGFNYTQTCGLTTTQQATTAYVNSGSWALLHPQNVTSNQSSNAFLQQAVTDATNASNALASLAPTQTLGNITCGTTITEGAGHYVLSLSNITLNQAALTFDAPKSASLVINISGCITINGGLQTSGLLLAGGITANNVIYNVTGGGTVTTTGVCNTSIQGSILDLKGGVNLQSTVVCGQIVAKYITSCNTSVISP